ncbi:hypothetical protein [Nocardia sp. XZ_19_385]|uniref:hypothetical protein n=1 Tax=Nocardia sp. XZ_19_385 TaxID=2769488 RepID=UPI00188F89AF|nr:hypothetical protein [Nocardia sp. XZ_19_385]
MENMGMRRAFATVGLAVAGAAVAGMMQAGSAAAVEPVVDPARGLYFGVVLNEQETVALSNSPLPAMLDGVYMSSATIRILGESYLDEDDENVYADLPEVVDTAAALDGIVGFALVDPAGNGGRPLRVVAVFP